MAPRNIVARAFTAKEACEISGLSLPMLNYLVRTEIVVPTADDARRRGRGRSRLFSFADLVLMRSLDRMLQAGVQVSRLKRALREVRRRGTQLSLRSSEYTHLVTNGSEVFLCGEDRSLEDLFSGQFAFAFVLDLGRIRRETAKAVKISTGLRLSA